MGITRLIADLLSDANLRQELGRDIRPLMDRYKLDKTHDQPSLASMDIAKMLERVKAEIEAFQFGAGEFDVPGPEWISDNGGTLTYSGADPKILRITPRQVTLSPTGRFEIYIYGESFGPGVDVSVQLVDSAGIAVFPPANFPALTRFGTYRASGIHALFSTGFMQGGRIPAGKYKVQVINYPGSPHSNTVTDNAGIVIA